MPEPPAWRYQKITKPMVDIPLGHHVFLGPAQFFQWASWAEIGLANAGTATEQLVGLGIPCVSLPGKGHQFNFNFAKRQSRLLGGAVVIAKDYDTLAKKVEFFSSYKFMFCHFI